MTTKVAVIGTTSVEVDEQYNLTCTTGGHNKFWSGLVGKEMSSSIKPYVVVLRWGKIGTNGQGPDIKRFESKHVAKTYLNGRVRDKLNKGYVHASVAPPMTAAPEAPTLKAPRAVTFKEGQHKWDLF